MTNREIRVRDTLTRYDDMMDAVVKGQLFPTRKWVAVRNDLAAALRTTITALEEIHSIPCWIDPETKRGGYDVEGEEWNLIRAITQEALYPPPAEEPVVTLTKKEMETVLNAFASLGRHSNGERALMEKIRQARA